MLLRLYRVLPKVLLKKHPTLFNLNFSKIRNMTNTTECTDIVWMDLEMTGLDVEKDKILEVSCLITDKDLNIKSEGLSIVINHPKEVLEQMNEWCLKQHHELCLVDQCLQSQINTTQAEKMILNYLKDNVPMKKCPLAGNTIYMDRLFLRKYMPTVNNYLHYRVIDVSTIKELARRWNHQVMDAAPQKKLAHRTLDDITESIAELQYFKQTFFIKN